MIYRLIQATMRSEQKGVPLDGKRIARINNTTIMNKEENKKAVDYFHAGPQNWNCAQSIVKSFQAETAMNDEDIELTYRSKGGGRAEGGLCGAVYSAKKVLGEDSPEAAALEEEFRKQWGVLTCKELKAEKRIPCTDTVDLADRLLEKYITLQKERLARSE